MADQRVIDLVLNHDLITWTARLRRGHQANIANDQEHHWQNYRIGGEKDSDGLYSIVNIRIAGEWYSKFLHDHEKTDDFDALVASTKSYLLYVHGAV
ncbi:uncharacterized protein ACA1_363400 [Acanthamoeba castellanii str. Neff]|uniref:Uncharacterized protein n=1 Tax=Acanthamoeba castellanii (strain ATCC 30010 / Neff) TaxID=1257118 RepID=L8GFH2_ACACF|nr:uncharacterized protein ACA1_363400 [Acanthamoeba castellanii str. Neff]ELR11840.1 hypothetical protein ACA1_363400 [Acanthamoeba castellanii str. Neff]